MSEQTQMTPTPEESATAAIPASAISPGKSEHRFSKPAASWPPTRPREDGKDG